MSGKIQFFKSRQQRFWSFCWTNCFDAIFEGFNLLERGIQTSNLCVIQMGVVFEVLKEVVNEINWKNYLNPLLLHNMSILYLGSPTVERDTFKHLSNTLKMTARMIGNAKIQDDKNQANVIKPKFILRKEGQALQALRFFPFLIMWSFRALIDLIISTISNYTWILTESLSPHSRTFRLWLCDLVSLCLFSNFKDFLCASIHHHHYVHKTISSV